MTLKSGPSGDGLKETSAVTSSMTLINVPTVQEAADNTHILPWARTTLTLSELAHGSAIFSG